MSETTTCTDDIDLSGDGGVLKKITSEGVGIDTPTDGCTVSVHYTGKLTNGEVFDSSLQRNVPFEFQLGKGSVIKAFDMCIATMKMGEKCVLTCAPNYAYGEGGSGSIPPNATLIFELEMLVWKGEDVSPEADGGIERFILKRSEKKISPNDGARVKRSVIKGFDIGIATMKLGEKCVLICAPDYGYGEGGSGSISPNATIVIELEMLGWKTEDLCPDVDTEIIQILAKSEKKRRKRNRVYVKNSSTASSSSSSSSSGRSSQQIKKPADQKKSSDDGGGEGGGASNTTASSVNSSSAAATANTKDEEDIYEFKTTPKDGSGGSGTGSAADDTKSDSRKSDKSSVSDEKSAEESSSAVSSSGSGTSATAAGQSKRPYSEVETNNDDSTETEDTKRKKRKDSENVKESTGKVGSGNRNAPQRQDKGSKNAGGSAKSLAGVANKVNTNLDRKSPCASPKPANKLTDSDAETDESKSNDNFGNGGPKVPPLKIVIPQQSTSGDLETGSRNGKNNSNRSHAALPYVVASSSNSNDSLTADKESASSRCASPLVANTHPNSMPRYMFGCVFAMKRAARRHI